MKFIVIICLTVVCFLVLKLVMWLEDKNNREEKQEKDSHPNVEIELKIGTEKPMPHIDIETTKKIEMETKEEERASRKTRGLFLRTLTKMGCQYEKNDEDNQIRFKWQGGNFTADVRNDSPFVVVWYLYWDEYELWDIDTLSRVKRVINEANINYNINVLYSVDEASSTFHVHSKKHFLFISQIPDLEDYLQSLLGQFFQIRHYIESELVKMKNEEEKVTQ